MLVSRASKVVGGQLGPKGWPYLKAGPRTGGKAQRAFPGGWAKSQSTKAGKERARTKR